MPIRKSNDTLFYLIGIIPVVWLALLLAQSLGGGLPELLRNLTSALEQPTNIIWTDKSLPTILICLAAYGMAVLLYRTNQGRTRDGEEHGSAAWATPASVNAQFAQKESIPLTQHVRLGLDTHKHRRSLNVLVIGGSGAAKKRSFVLPNILTANTNYVITDPKSEVLLATGGYLKEQGYDVRVLNLVNLEQSDGYNPFRYLRDEKDVLKLVNNLIQSTTPKGSHESDPFWTKAETALLQAIILMLFQEAPEYEQNFSMVMRVLEYAEVREEDEGHVSPLDLLFESIERRKPDSVAVRQYKVFKLAAGKTAKSILVSTAVRLAPFNLPQIQALTDHDDMDLYTLGEKKVALYAVIPDNDNTFTHDAILPQGMFQAAQTLLQSRGRKFGRKMSQSEYPLTSRIRCSECGAFYHRKVRNGTVKWVCSRHAADTTACNSGYYSEERIYDGIITMINKLRFCEEDILGQTIQKLEFAAAAYKRNNRAASQLSQSIAELNAKLLALERLRTKGYLAADIYHTQAREIRQQLDKLKTERYSSFESKILTMLEDVRKLKSLIDELEQPLEVFDEKLFHEIVTDICINHHDEMTVTLLGGLRFTEQI